MTNQTPDFYVKHPGGQTRIYVGATDTKNQIENYAPCLVKQTIDEIRGGTCGNTQNKHETGLWSYSLARLENIDPDKFQAMITGICEVCRKCERQK